jgi:hypothetical protein
VVIIHVAKHWAIWSADDGTEATPSVNGPAQPPSHQATSRGTQPAPLQDILHHLAMLNPEWAAEVHRLIVEKCMARRKRVPAQESVEG